jgi:hypothetical protein
MITYKSKKDEYFWSIKLYFSYSSSFIDRQFRNFSLEYMSHSSSFLPIINDEQQFKRMRQNKLGQPTPQP